MGTKKLITIDEHLKQNGGNIAEAARSIGEEYMQYYRWLKRTCYARDHSKTRKVLEALGIDLPRRP
jgi:hypothetical protein